MSPRSPDINSSFTTLFGGNAWFHVENSRITQVNGTLHETRTTNERIVQNTGNVHDIRYKETNLEHVDIDKRTRGSKGRDSSKETRETSDSESAADESEEEGEEAHRGPLGPRSHAQHEFTNTQDNIGALLNTLAARDVRVQREQRASGILPPHPLLSPGPPARNPNMLMPALPAMGALGAPGYGAGLCPPMSYNPGMNIGATHMSTSYAVQNPNGTTTTTITSISGLGMGLPVIGSAPLQLVGVTPHKGHVQETRRIETSEAWKSGIVSNVTRTSTKTNV